MPNLSQHIYRTGPKSDYALNDADIIFVDGENEENRTAKEERRDNIRKHIEPWLTAVFQSEHLSLLLGSGFSTSIAHAAGGQAASMGTCDFGCTWAEQVDQYATTSAQKCGRGAANIEDQFRAAFRLRDGLEVIGDEHLSEWNEVLNREMARFLSSILDSERTLKNSESPKIEFAEDLLVSFLLSFASRAATRERLNVFTTNYDRFIEYGCDLAGLHVIDRFIGCLAPIFRVSRLNLDLHYNPPGIRGEPRYLEGVLRLFKLHGSLDWRWEGEELRRIALPFGAQDNHPGMPEKPTESVMIYPNAAKDMETLEYPYAELFRDLAAAVCRPNSSLVTYGYGFGDDHINRVIKDMLTIPSTHLVVIAWDRTIPSEPEHPQNSCRKRIIEFCKDTGRKNQVSLLLGSHFGDLTTLIDNYLPKPAIDQITIRKTKIVEQRGESYQTAIRENNNEHTD